MNESNGKINKELISSQAANWLLRLHDEGEPSTALCQQWKDWVSQSDEHLLIYNKMHKLWCLVNDLEVVLPESAFSGVSANEHSQTQISNDDYQRDVPSAIVPSVASGNSSIVIKNYARAIAASIAIVFMVTVVWIFDFHKERTHLVVRHHYETNIAEHKQVRLSDGSLIELGAKTSIDVIYKNNQRLVILNEGEGLFTVYHDPTRSFIVRSGVGIVQAIGTAFNVHKGPDEIKITVVEGVIQVSALPADLSSYVATDEQVISNHLDNLTRAQHKNPHSRLVVGEAVSVSHDGSVGEIDQSASEFDTAWRDGRLVYMGITLDRVIADLNRYSNQMLFIESNTIGKLRYTGTILQDGIDEWIKALPSAFDVDIVLHQDKVLITDIDSMSK